MVRGQVCTILDMSNNDQRTHRRQQGVMAVIIANLVLDEIFRLEHLANVMKIRPYPY